MGSEAPYDLYEQVKISSNGVLELIEAQLEMKRQGVKDSQAHAELTNRWLMQVSRQLLNIETLIAFLGQELLDSRKKNEPCTRPSGNHESRRPNDQ